MIEICGVKVDVTMLALVLIGVIAFIAMTIKSKKRKKSAGKEKKYKYAKDYDADRVAEEKAKNSSGKEKKKKKNYKNFKLADHVNRTVAQTMPYKKVLHDNIWLIEDNTYSKAYSFQDINYNLGDVDQQFENLQNYSNFLSTLDDTLDCQICMCNSRVNMDDFEADTLIKPVDDGCNELRNEYNERVLKENIKKGQNVVHKRMVLTMTIRTSDEDYAVQKFKTLDHELKVSFDRIGHTHLRVMTSQQRVEFLKDFFIGIDVDIPELTERDFQKQLDKVYCSPDYFEFKSDYFMFNDKYAKCIFIKDYPARASDDILTDLFATNLDVIATTNIITHDPAKARKLVQHQITAVDTNMAQREQKAAQHGNFSSQTPVRIKNQLDGYKSLYDKITVDDQKLYLVNTIIMITAKSHAELTANLDIVKSSLKRNGCMFGEMKYQQEDGMVDCLPCGSHRRFEWRRNLPTESVAIFQPFNVKEIQQKDSTYYGLNVLSNNMITFDRMRSLINPSGFILGCPGSGKSFKGKEEMMGVFMRNPNADIMIIDPEREYRPLVEMFGGTTVKISLGSSNYINPFDFDKALLEDPEVDVIADKCQLITSFISCMDKTPLNAQEVSFIDRCVHKTYDQSGYLQTFDIKDMPTLGDFRDVMKSETNVDERIQNKLLLTIEMYVDGSARYFNNQTNVDVNNRIISYDIKDLQGTLKTQSMLLVLDYIWNRLSRNRDLGKSTWIYIDEVYLLFADEYCLDFLRALYKRARKYGGVVTGITQNVEDLLKDDKCRTMLSNSEFLVLLKQAPADIIKLRDTLKFTESEVDYVRNVKAGQGLLILGGKDKIPFYDEFPKDTELYKRINTSFSETANSKLAAANSPVGNSVT